MERDKYFWIALAITLISLAYWLAYNLNAYNAYHLTTETAQAMLSFYYTTHLSNLNSGLKLLTAGQHITPLTVALIAPFFYFFPTPLLFMIIKALVLSLTALIVFYVARGFTKDAKFALALTFVYLINPATIQMNLFEYHPELFIIPLYLLTFYYCMKVNKKAFYVSLFLLLCVFESVLSIAFTLGLGILAYELIYDKEAEMKKDRIKLACMIMIGTVLALAAYNLIYYQIQGSYNSTYPPAEQIAAFPLVPLLSHSSYSFTQDYSSASLPSYIASSFELGIASFGFIALAVFLPVLIFLSPWLSGIFILHNLEFLYAWKFSYEIGGAMVGTMLGYVVLMRLAPKLKLTIVNHIVKFMVIIAVVLSLATLLQILFAPAISPLINPVSEMIFFKTTSGEAMNITQLRYVLNLVPKNASVLTQFNLYPYLSNRQYVETIGGGSSYFKPEYIVSDTAIASPLRGINESALLANYTANDNYTIIEQNGFAVLWKKK